jgi:hypothetical protein
MITTLTMLLIVALILYLIWYVVGLFSHSAPALVHSRPIAFTCPRTFILTKDGTRDFTPALFMNQPLASDQKESSHNVTTLLTTLASSGDNWVKLGTLTLVALSGLGNWIATQRNSDEINANGALLHEQRTQVFNKVSQMHDELNDIYRQFDNLVERQKQGITMMNESLENETRMLKNQQQMLSDIHKSTVGGGDGDYR